MISASHYVDMPRVFEPVILANSTLYDQKEESFYLDLKSNWLSTHEMSDEEYSKDTDL